MHPFNTGLNSSHQGLSRKKYLLPGCGNKKTDGGTRETSEIGSTYTDNGVNFFYVHLIVSHESVSAIKEQVVKLFYLP